MFGSSNNVRQRKGSAAGSTNVPKKRLLRARKKPAWDSTVNDLTTLKSTPEELDRRKMTHRSQNVDLVKQEKLRKHVAKLRQQKQLTDSMQSTYTPSSMLREMLYGHSDVNEALETSDRLMASVRDLLGDNTKKFLGLPLVTKAPHHSALDRSLPEVADVVSRLDLNSESVMDRSALNDMDSSSSTTGSLEEQSATDSYQTLMDIARFQQLIHEAELDQLVSKDSSTTNKAAINQEKVKSNRHIYQAQRNDKESEYRPTEESRSTAKNEKDSGSKSSGQMVGGGDVLTPVSSPRTRPAMNDTDRVQRVRSVLGDRQNQPPTSVPTMEDFNEMLSTIQTSLADCQAVGFEQSQRPMTYSGYTMALLDAVVKMSLYIKQSEMRSRAERANSEQLSCEVQQLRGLVDALTADVLAAQEEYSRLKNEFVKQKRDSEVQWLLLNQTLASHGIHLQVPLLQQQLSASQTVNARPIYEGGYVQAVQKQFAVPVSVSEGPSSENLLQAVNTETDRRNFGEVPDARGVVQQHQQQEPLLSDNRQPQSTASRSSSSSVNNATDGAGQVERPSNDGGIAVDHARASVSTGHQRPNEAATSRGRVPAPGSDNLVAGPVLLDQMAFDNRREVIRRQIFELNRQRQLAQAKVDELKRHQMQLSEKPKVSPSISPITVASEPSCITFTTQTSDTQMLITGRPDEIGSSRQQLNVRMTLASKN